VPAVRHVDDTGRLQTVSSRQNVVFRDLLREFHRRTGVPLLLNTSFNVMGEPIVETPEDALWCFLYSGIDVCVLGDRIVHKSEEYRSVLDLVPSWNAKKVALEMAAQPGGRLVFPSATALTFRFEVETRWGPLTHDYKATGFFWFLLEGIDGKRSGWDLVDLLGERLGRLFPEPEVKALLGGFSTLRVRTGEGDPQGQEVSELLGDLVGHFLGTLKRLRAIRVLAV
jgi:carbamoyltransferase